MLDLEIRQQIGRYVREDIDAAELEEWLTANTWDAESEDPMTRRLAADALRLVSEHANGDWADEVLRERLGALSRSYWFEKAPKRNSSGTIAVVIRHDQRSAAADRRLVVESA